MAKVSFSAQEQDLDQIAAQHARLSSAVFHYFDNAGVGDMLPEPTFESIEEARESCLTEIEHASSLAALAALEAAIRVDFLERVYARRKDPLSRAMRDLHKEKGNRARLEDELLELWKVDGHVSASVISGVRAAFHYRHWLAHGRYWLLKAGRSYDFTTVYQVSDALINEMDAYQGKA